MSHSQIVAAPRWRHFFPFAPDLTLVVPGQKASPDANGQMVFFETFRYSYVADGSAAVQLPASIHADNTDSISVLLNGVAYPNPMELIFAIPQDMLIHSAFNYDGQTNVLTFRNSWQMPARIPVAGTAVEVNIRNIRNEASFYRVDIPKEWWIQGARPMDLTLINPNEVGLGQFQGGYRCAPEIVAVGTHGASQVSPDKLALWYKPDMGYIGVDSFSYRLVNSMGQQSNAACVTVTVGL